MPDETLPETHTSQLNFCWECSNCSRLGLKENTTIDSAPFDKLRPNFGKYKKFLQSGEDVSPVFEQAFALQNVYIGIRTFDTVDLGSFPKCRSSVLWRILFLLYRS